MQTMQKLLFLFIMGASILQSSFSSSLYEKKELAQTYYDSKLYDDAIIVYEEIYENIDIKIDKTKRRDNPGQLGLKPGAFMEGY